MKIAICGAGISGAYLYRLLKNCSYDVTIYDMEKKTNCGINPCAWGTSKGFEDLVGRAGLNPLDYIIRSRDHIWFDEIKIKAYMLTIDKPILIHDLLMGAKIQIHPKINVEDYDMVIDATGVARAYLPPIPNDLISPCYQYRMVSDEPAEMRIKIGRVGYAWSFPLSDKELHVGAGSLVMDPIQILKDMQWIYPKFTQKVKCACYSNVRLTAPMGSRPFVHGNVWGIGESIGAVAPLAGDGILHGMKSSLLLLKNIDSPADYERAILREFAWMEKEREVVERLQSGKPIGLGSALVLQRNTRRMDMKLGLWDAFKILRRAGK
jgi:flavin-dependent dehydrogenase